jgi:hypothetical protein
LGWLLGGWFFLAIIPAAITREGYRPNRASALLTLFEIIMALGASYLIAKLARYKRWLIMLATVLTVTSLLFYLNDYAFASRVKYPTAMAYGWRDAAKYLADHQSQYDQIYIEKAGQAQSFVAFYLAVDPKTFQGNSTTWDAQTKHQHITYLDQLDVYQLGRFTFKHLNFPEDIHPKTLYLANLAEDLLPKDRQTLTTILARADKSVFEFFTFNVTQ